MKRISILKNTIQEYAWGSFTAIPELLGNPSPSQKPQAELWMGAHPKAPSLVNLYDKWIPLDKVIRADSLAVLGKAVSEKFHDCLPFLFKVLAADRPLSIQAHPNLIQAKAGFEKENNLGIPLEASNRNFKDDNHKPECICALTPFWALNGFRSTRKIIQSIRQCCPSSLKKEGEELERNQTDEGLKRFFETLMLMDPDKKKKVIEEAVNIAENFRTDDMTYDWMIKFYQEYPTDIGVISPVILNLIVLQPGQAMFLPAGQLHAYLKGVGMELMANSDNVLRGGLTPKHVDVPELLNVLRFKESRVMIHSPDSTDVEYVYPSDAEEFVLSVISVNEETAYRSRELNGVEILFCAKGSATIKSVKEETPVVLDQGVSVLVPAAARAYDIAGNATIYKAAVPI